MHLTTETITDLDISDGFLDFVETVAGKAQQWGDNFATVFQKTTLAETLDKDVRTITRYVGEIKKKGLGDVETKRGRNGGTVIVFNKDVLNFKKTDNPITSETKEADEIRDLLFPSYKRPEPLRRYRTKEEITEAKLLAKARKTKEWELNEILGDMPHVTREFFNNFDEPELYYKAYLVSRMYNAYAIIFPRERMLMYAEEGNTKMVNFNKKAIDYAQNWDVMPFKFVGTPEYNVFVDLQRKFDEKDIDPLGFLTTQFEHTMFLSEHKRARANAIPFLNSMKSDDAMERYLRQERYYSWVRNRYNDRKLSKEKVLYIGAKYPIIQALRFAYKGVTLEADLDHLIDEMSLNASTLKPLDYSMYGLELDANDKRHNEYVNRIDKLTRYYNTVLADLSESDVSTEDKELITSYLKEQVALYSRKNSLSATQFMLSFPVQILDVKRVVEGNGSDISNYFAYVGNLGKTHIETLDQYDAYVNMGELIDFSLDGANTFRETNRMIAHDSNMGLNPWDVGKAIRAYGEHKIPIDQFGMLDLNEILKL